MYLVSIWSSGGVNATLLIQKLVEQEMMDDNYIYCGNHFLIYVSQVIMLYTLNFHSSTFQISIDFERKPKN